jgi:dolichol-phosphate mannosyltransferase
MKQNNHHRVVPTRALIEAVTRPTEKTQRESVVIVPTYNEAINLKLLVPGILQRGPFDVLIVDDNSPDGTGNVAEDLKKRFAGRVDVLHRSGKLGLGTAYLAGFRYALAMGYRQVFTMDADFSHDPSHLPDLRAALDKADVALGSRYVPGGDTLNWSLRRRILSRAGSAYARLVLGLSIRDLTGGFKGFRSQVLETLIPEMDAIHSTGYAFQIEMTYLCSRHGFRIVEVPILFEDRLVGTSKMNRRLVAEALWIVWALRLSKKPSRTRPRRDVQAATQVPLGRMMAVIMALVGLIIIMGTVTLAPRWVSHLEQGVAAQPVYLSQARPAPSVRLRHVPLRGRAHPSLQPPTSLQMQGADLTPNVPLRFAGAGFLPGEVLKVTIQNQTGQLQAQLAPAKADAVGQVGSTLEVIPAKLAPGTYWLLVEGMSSHRKARASFQMHWIQPSVQLDIYSAKPEHTVGFAGSGFLPDEIVEARLGTTGQVLTQVVATVSANAQGQIAGRITTPLLPEGNYSLFFAGRQSQTPIVVGFSIQGFHPWVVLDTYAPAPHAHIGFMGRDFAPGEEVLVYLNQQGGKPVAHFFADTTGRFIAQAAWEVPRLSGENTLIFVGQQSGAITTTTFTEMP